jgi:hypothetical protein
VSTTTSPNGNTSCLLYGLPVKERSLSPRPFTNADSLGTFG